MLLCLKHCSEATITKYLSVSLFQSSISLLPREPAFCKGLDSWTALSDNPLKITNNEFESLCITNASLKTLFIIIILLASVLKVRESLLARWVFCTSTKMKVDLQALNDHMQISSPSHSICGSDPSFLLHGRWRLENSKLWHPAQEILVLSNQLKPCVGAHWELLLNSNF